MQILQWNLNSYFKRLENLQKLLYERDPHIVCIQETNFKSDFCASIKGYTSFCKNRETNHASGGVATFVKNDIYSTQVSLNTSLEALAVTCYIPYKIVICNVYLPNSRQLELSELNMLKQQLDKPFILIGDFNAHNTLWGSTHTDTRGLIIEKFLEDPHMIILNDNLPTHFNVANGNESCIDLCIASTDVADKLEWEVSEFLHDSDHFPIFVHISLGNKTFEQKRHTQKWQYKKANWGIYRSVMNDNIKNLIEPCIEIKNNINELIENFKQTIYTAANAAIPIIKIAKRKNQVPWWNDNCSSAMKEAKHAFNKFKKHSTPENKMEHNRTRAIYRRTLKETKKNYWLNFVNSLNANTPSAIVWQNIQRIQGKFKPNNINILINEEKKIISNSDEIADELAKTFAKNSSDENYQNSFLIKKNNSILSQKFATQSNTKMDTLLNSEIDIKEITEILNGCKNSSPGPDLIPNILLKNLPESAIDYLAKLLNMIWTGEVFTNQWTLATVIPIRKPGKDITRAKNYRPISLTNNLCKLMEKILNKRLKTYLESINFFNPYQSGFRENRSTYDHLIALENAACQALRKKQHLIAISLDIEKAYEMVCRERIIKILKELEIKGHMLSFIENFLKQRFIQVQDNNTLSKEILLKNGVPQGSVLSVTLFLVAINNITNNIKAPVKCGLFADDLTIYASGNNFKITAEVLQNTLNELDTWSKNNGFKFSSEKTQYIMFTNKRKIPKIHLKIYNNEIKEVDNLKILGLTFDRKLSWKNHIQILKTECLNRLKIIKVLAAKNWGADQKVLINTYKAIILPKLDYGCILYDSSKMTKSLEPIQNTSIKISLGAYHTSPTNSLLAESNILPLASRRKILMANYACKIASLPDNMTHKIIFDNEDISYQEFNTSPEPFTKRLLNSLLDFNVDIPEIIIQTGTPDPVAINKLQIYNNEQSDKYNPTEAPFKIFITTHRTENSIGVSINTKKENLKYTFSTKVKPNFVEYWSLMRSIDIVNKMDEIKYEIFTESQNLINSLKNPYSQSVMIKNIQNRLIELNYKQINIIKLSLGNKEQQAQFTKMQAIETYREHFTDADTPCTHTDAALYIKKAIQESWNYAWSTNKNSFLHKMRENTYTASPTINLARQDQVLLNRIRIGHSNITHSYLLSKEEPPSCSTCETRKTIEHILLDCAKHRVERRNCNINTDIKTLLNTEDGMKNVIKFVKVTKLRGKI